MGRTACTEPQCLYKALYFFTLHQTDGKLWASINWLIDIGDTRMTVDKMTTDVSVAYELNVWESTVPSIYSIIHF
jgi:hypothetical protein